jgi:hypothetical protein
VIPKAGQSPEGYLDFFTGFHFASPEGAAIVEQMDRRTSVRTWLLLVDPVAPLQRLAASSDRYQSILRSLTCNLSARSGPSLSPRRCHRTLLHRRHNALSRPTRIGVEERSSASRSTAA